jgi:NDP-sugar pyrophosphorylase family protein
MKIVVPMAGRGSRFQAEAHANPEYRKPKPLILIRGKPMIEWAMESLPFLDLPNRPAKTAFKASPSDFIFISLQQQEKDYRITYLLKGVFGQEIQVILIPEVTRGALETALKAKDFINTDEDLIISDSDHYFDGSSLYEAIEQKDSDVEGIIPIFQPPDEEVKWSYTLFDSDNVALAVGEKDAKLADSGAYANIGGYYFSHGKVFVSVAEEIIQGGSMYGPEGKQEFYVAPIYQYMIDKGLKIKVAAAPTVWGLGTPKDLEYFLANHKE